MLEQCWAVLARALLVLANFKAMLEQCWAVLARVLSILANFKQCWNRREEETRQVAEVLHDPLLHLLSPASPALASQESFLQATGDQFQKR